MAADVLATQGASWDKAILCVFFFFFFLGGGGGGGGNATYVSQTDIYIVDIIVALDRMVFSFVVWI